MSKPISFSHLAGGYSWPDTWANQGQQVEVGVRPLGEFLRGRTVAVMKMDVEANEVGVLKVG